MSEHVIDNPNADGKAGFLQRRTGTESCTLYFRRLPYPTCCTKVKPRDRKFWQIQISSGDRSLPVFSAIEGSHSRAVARIFTTAHCWDGNCRRRDDMFSACD